MNEGGRWLVYGSNGYLGSMFCKHLRSIKQIVIPAFSRCQNATSLRKEIETVSPNYVVAFVGKTSGPGCNTIDYLQGRLKENLENNLVAQINLAQICKSLCIHHTIIATGCIYQGDETKKFTESDEPNFFGSDYSTMKASLDRLVYHFFPDVLYCRIRMPISSVPNPRNFIDKITSYEKICSISNSMTVIDDFLPIITHLAQRSRTGIYNMVNPGFITHNEILQIYKEEVDPKFEWKNFSLEEQSKILKAGRSNCILDTSKIENEVDVPKIHDSVRQILKKYKNNKRYFVYLCKYNITARKPMSNPIDIAKMAPTLVALLLQ